MADTSTLACGLAVGAIAQRDERVRRILAACGLALAAPASFAASDCKPVVGGFEASIAPLGVGHRPPTASFFTAGQFWGGIQRRTSGQMKLRGILTQAHRRSAATTT